MAAAVATSSDARAGHGRPGPAAGTPDPRRGARRWPGANNAAKSVKPPAAPRRRDVHLSDDNDRRDPAPGVPARPGAGAGRAGLRISEACGPASVRNVDFLRKTVLVRPATAARVATSVRLKTDSVRAGHPGRRQRIGRPRRRSAGWPRHDGLVFSSSSGRPLTKAIAGHEFDAIEPAVGFSVSPHSLRHHFGASLISRGVSIVAVSSWLGHSSPEITCRVYAYLKPDDEQAGRDAIAKTMRQVLPHVYPVCTEKGAE